MPVIPGSPGEFPPGNIPIIPGSPDDHPPVGTLPVIPGNPGGGFPPVVPGSPGGGPFGPGFPPIVPGNPGDFGPIGIPPIIPGVPEDVNFPPTYMPPDNTHTFWGGPYDPGIVPYQGPRVFIVPENIPWKPNRPHDGRRRVWQGESCGWPKPIVSGRGAILGTEQSTHTLHSADP
jgi:hypothetical protein